METTRAERIRLGVFVTIALTVLLGSLVFIAGQKLLHKRVTYYTYFSESVDGLNPGAKVKLNGVVVGQVTRLAVDTANLERIRVRMELEPETPVKEGMRANLVGGLSITGLKTVELSGGDVREPNIPPGGIILAGASQLKQLTGQAESIAEKFEMGLNNLISITGDHNQAYVAALLRDLSRLVSVTDTIITRSRPQWEALPQQTYSALQNVSLAAENAQRLVADLQKAELGKSINNTLESYQKTSELVRNRLDGLPLEATIGDLQKAIGSVETAAKRADLTIFRMQDDMNSAMRALRETMQNMNDFSRQIRENPSLLLRAEEKQGRVR